MTLVERARSGARTARAAGNAIRRTLDHSSFPTTHGTSTVRGADDRIEIVRDRWGVPHVLAATATDAFFGHGYVHAQDRLFQMEGARRTAAGRLSEIAGAATLAGDRLMRRIGLNRAARSDVARLSGPTLELMEAYARGVNEGVRHLAALPPEFALLGDGFEPWGVEDTMLVGRLVMFGFAGNWNTELVRERLAAQLGPDLASAVDPVHPPTSTVTGETYPRSAAALLEAYRAAFPWGGGSGLSSNAWAVSGSHSASGRPLLASDPHVDVALPGLFHVAHVRGGALDVVGAGVPGIPGAVIGHNRTVAWGITAGMADVADCYIEEFEAPSSNRYRTPEGWVEATEVVERIEVLGAASVDERILLTRHGPVVGPALRGEWRAIALRSSAVEGGDIASPFLALSRAATFDEAFGAIESWPGTTFNVVLASNEGAHGRIGYRFVGEVPERPAHGGLFPQRGAESAGPPGFVEPGRLPRLVDPASGVVVSANNAPGGALQLGEEWCDPQRWERIVELLRARDRHDVESFCAIQRDRRSAHLERLRDVIVDRGIAPEGVRERLRAWDGYLDATSREGALVSLAYRLLAVDGAERVAGRLGRVALGASVDGVPVNSAFAYRSQRMLIDAVVGASGPWFDGPEDRDRRLRGAVMRALDVLGGSLEGASAGEDGTLGDVQAIPFHHALHDVPGLGALWSRGSRPFGGDINTVVQAQGSVDGLPNEIRIAPGYRQVLDLGDWDRGLFMIPTGNSGIPGHPRYDDCIDEYVAGAYRPLLFNELAIRSAAESVLTLEPAPERSATSREHR